MQQLQPGYSCSPPGHDSVIIINTPHYCRPLPNIKNDCCITTYAILHYVRYAKTRYS